MFHLRLTSELAEFVMSPAGLASEFATAYWCSCRPLTRQTRVRTSSPAMLLLPAPTSQGRYTHFLHMKASQLLWPAATRGAPRSHEPSCMRS